LAPAAALLHTGTQRLLIIRGLHAALAVLIDSPLAHAPQDLGLLRLKFLWILLQAGAKRLRISGRLYAALPLLEIGEALAQLLEDFGLLGQKLPSLSCLPSTGSILAGGNSRKR